VGVANGMSESSQRRARAVSADIMVRGSDASNTISFGGAS
jgi:hypothetical protein